MTDRILHKTVRQTLRASGASTDVTGWMRKELFVNELNMEKLETHRLIPPCSIGQSGYRLKAHLIVLGLPQANTS